ncbi:NADH-quinone oxidoreductase subunit L [Salinarimonas chemoclinalis]|uniref:NADH-quinone oxidoreductase subunit L n=1 Tax=Salinarimonas chemoclinalis TaxID=3241599 RepID=UPI003556D22F
MYQAIVFLPLLGFLVAGIFGRFIGARPSEIVTTALLVVSAALSWVAFFDVAMGEGPNVFRVQVATWMVSGGLSVDWAFRIDTLTVVMLVVVNTVSALVHLYSIGYMHEDPSRPRFFAYLSLFTFAMLMLVTSDNLVQMFFGWEGVGLASYLLIGFWYQKPSANAAALKAFVVNRVGDFGFALGIFAVFFLFGSVQFEEIFAQIAAYAEGGEGPVLLGLSNVGALELAALLLFMGAMGKSAQFLLHTWLPDAMEGPTPVSALIHAATMVTAGVFLVARMSPLYEYTPLALTVVTYIGALTAFFAATVGLVQNDIKRVIAYSTCSQLGYMFVALGVGAYGVGVFHLFTHAFFKALLFLGAGSVIHALHHEQDLRNMGGLRRHIPFTAAMMAIGTLALTGFPFTAGYYSKDAVIEAAYASPTTAGDVAFVATVIAALFTSFYSWRLFFLAFEGAPRWAGHGDSAHASGGHHDHEGVDHGAHDRDLEPASAAAHEHGGHGHGHGHGHAPHESPLVMTIPLGILAVGALAAGFLFKESFVGDDWRQFWEGAIYTREGNTIMEDFHYVPAWVVWSPFVAMVIGFALAFWMYIRDKSVPVRLAARHPVLYRFLLNKWYVDELYDMLFVRPAKRLGRFLWRTGDGKVIDGLGPDGVSARVLDATSWVVRLQTGYIYHYAFVMMIGVAALVTWYLVTGAR